MRNADIERIPQSGNRTLTNTDTRLVANTTFNRRTRQTRWVDPLAQSFEVPDENGVYLTKCEYTFESKDNNELLLLYRLELYKQVYQLKKFYHLVSVYSLQMRLYYLKMVPNQLHLPSITLLS